MNPSETPLRVVVVLPPGSRFDVDRPTSIETVVRSLGEHSRDREALTIICDDGAERGDALTTLAIAPEPSAGRRARIVADHIARLKPDLIEVHQHMPSAAALVKQLGRTPGPRIPVILYRHNLLPGANNPFKQWRHRKRVALFDGHLFVSEVGRAEFVDRYPRLADRAVAMPNAIDTTLWRAEVAGREPLIAFAGRAAPEKGLAALCGALNTVLEAAPDWRAELALCDWETHQAWSEAQLRPLERFGDRVAVSRNAPRDAVRSLFQRAAIVVIPSLWREPFGLVAIEAHAAGSAVVSSGMGGLAEASGDHSMRVPPCEDFPARLADGLLELIGQPDAREALAAAGQAHAVQAHDARDRSLKLDAARRRFANGGSGRP